VIKLVVALMPEAEPIIANFELDPIEGAFPIFRNDEAALIVSGIGKSAAAAATAYLHAKTDGATSDIWLNVGIAGHRDRPLGTNCLAHEVIDQASGKRWRLEVPELHLPSDTVWTVDRPNKAYENDGLYDMEAAGFLAAATRFVPFGLIQCFKVVSDNRSSSTEKITPPRVRTLLEEALPDLTATVRTTQARTATIKEEGT
jgi:nucleoside phosphorylase